MAVSWALSSLLFVTFAGDAPVRPVNLALAPVAFELPAQTAFATVPEEKPTRETLLGAQRVLKLATAGALLLTSTGGVLTAINHDTLLWDGRCGSTDRRPILGQYGCEYLSLWHGIGAVGTTALYTANAVVSLAIPDYPDDSPTGRPDSGGDFYRALNWTHLVVLSLQPIIGFLSAYPGLIGIDASSRDTFSRTLRTVHAATGVLAMTTFGASLAMEF